MSPLDKAKQFLDAWNEPGAKPGDSAPLGKGMARQASDTLRGRAYQLHKQEADALGEPPMSPEEFEKSRKS